MTKAVYAGSFDPITVGHLDIIQQAAKSFEKVIVLVATNPEKANQYMFSAKDRMDMVKRALNHLPNVEVDILSGGYAIHYAERVGATALIRGLRDAKDFEAERQIFTFNNFENPAISTIFFMASPELAHISSSYVKENCYGTSGWIDVIDKYVPGSVNDYLQNKYLKKIYRTCMNDEGSFHKIYGAYRKMNRYYHDISHIIRMHDELMDFFQEYQRGDRVYYLRISVIATLFHDFYIESDFMPGEVVRFGYNVQKHCYDELVNNFQKLAELNEGDSKMIKETIMATRHGPHDRKIGYNLLPVIDADLAIFGQSPSVYAKYAEDIRKEYGFVPDEEYRTGRIKVLQSFLDKERIYETGYFYGKYEARARANLENELASLVNNKS